MKPRPRTLVIGCGYIGLPLALQLQGEGHDITAWVHSPATAESLVPHRFDRVIVGSVADEQIWSSVDSSFDQVIHCASSGRGGPDAYEEVFQQGIARLVTHQPIARKLFVSSTSVYAQTGGEIVTEESSAEPSTATGKILREAEKIAVAAGIIVARSSGIYGPGRGVLLAKFLRGEAIIEGDGSRWINQIHQRDLVSALVHLLTHGLSGQVYNVTDDTPISLRDFYATCSEFFQQPMPPYGPVNTERKRGLTNKRISNARLRSTGWKPCYPSFRDALVAGDYSPR